MTTFSLPRFRRLPGRQLLLMLLVMTISTARAQVYYLDLSALPLGLPERSIFVEAVVDGRPGQPPIGTVYKGLENRTAAVVFRQGMVPEFTTWVQTWLPRRPTDRPVVLCLRQLRISEELSGMVELARADLAADVYEHRADGYHFLATVADYISQKSLESTTLHRPHLARLMQNCLAQIPNPTQASLLHTPARTLDQLAADVPRRTQLAPILRQARPRAGVYYRFEQFLANRPDTTAQIRFDTTRMRNMHWEGTLSTQPRLQTAGGDRISLKQVWGVSDGQRVYMAYNKMCWPLTRQSNYFTFVGAAPRDMEAATRRAKQGALAGGVMTAMIGSMVATSVDDGSARPMVYALDMQTGQAGPQLRPGQPQQADTAYLYVYRPPGGPAGPQRIRLNDREVGQLRPGEYLELMWPYFGHPARLVVDFPGNPAILLAPSTTEATYIRLQPSAALTPWQVMTPREGGAAVDALERPGR